MALIAADAGVRVLQPHYHAGHHGTDLQAQATSPQYCAPQFGDGN